VLIQPVRRKCLVLLTILGIGMAPNLGCRPAESSRQTFHGLDGTIEIQAPSTWSALPGLHRNADIQIGNAETEEFLLVVSERKEKLSFENSEQYSEYTRTPLVERMSQAFEFGPTPLTVNGLPGILYEIRGMTPNDNQVTYLHAVLESPRYFHQIVIWATYKRFRENKAELMGLVTSFAEK